MIIGHDGNDQTLAAVAKDKYVDLVFEGGGVWGVALVGALCTLEERGYIPQNIAGTSAGAIAASLVAAGYTGKEIHAIMMEQHFSAFADSTWASLVPLVGMPLSILLELGLHKGDVVLQLMRKYLAAKGVHTFRDLIDPRYADQPKYRYKLQVIASDITTQQMLVLPQDAHVLGIAPDDLEVALAVRMSMSIPIFFEPVKFHNARTKETHLITDGSMLSNFPIWLFDEDGTPEWPTFGLKLVASDAQAHVLSLKPIPTHGPGMVIGFLGSIVQTMMNAHDRMYLDKDTIVRTVTIPTLDIPGTNFDLTNDQLTALYESGRTAATNFLAQWDFGRYVTEFRSVTQPSIPRVAPGVARSTSN